MSFSGRGIERKHTCCGFSRAQIRVGLYKLYCDEYKKSIGPIKLINKDGDPVPRIVLQHHSECSA